MSFAPIVSLVSVSQRRGDGPHTIKQKVNE